MALAKTVEIDMVVDGRYVKSIKGWWNGENLTIEGEIPRELYEEIVSSEKRKISKGAFYNINRTYSWSINTITGQNDTTKIDDLSCLNCGEPGHVWIYLNNPMSVHCGACEAEYNINEKIMEVSLRLNGWKEVAKWLEKAPTIKKE